MFPLRFGAKSAVGGMLLIVMLMIQTRTRAQTLTDLGATAPTPGTYDIAQLSIAGNVTNSPPSFGGHSLGATPLTGELACRANASLSWGSLQGR